MENFTGLFTEKPLYEVFISKYREGERYGVSVVWRGERAIITDITSKKEDIADLIQRLRRGNVLPSVLRDVVEDWLER